MQDDLLHFEMPINISAIIKVLGVGGGGSNAVNHMYRQGIKGVDFVVTNTDAQALLDSPVPVRIQLGATLTEGLGAGNQPERGREAAIESIETVKKEIGVNTKMIFITAGMGGGTGTGAAPIIAQATKEMGILTVGIVTIPFRYEGPKRLTQAIEGIKEMSKHVDSLLVINNEKLREMYGDSEARVAFAKADDVLTVAARGIAEIITKKGHINVDFADVKTVMKDSGIALLGTGVAGGEDRARKAVEDALNSPLLDNNDIHGAGDILLNITSGTKEATMDEISFINEYVQHATGDNADLIWGSSIDESLGENISVTVIATGFGTRDIDEIYLRGNQKEEEEAAKKVKLQNDNESENDYNQDDEIPFEIEDSQNNSYNEVLTLKDDNNSDDYSEKYEKNSFNDYDDYNDNNDNTLKQKITVKTVETKENPGENYYSAKRKQYKLSEYKQNVEELEKQPAYTRKNVKLNNDRSYDNENVSRYTISTRNDDVYLSENNKFLHEKPD